jgi:hypothetical protein
MQRESLIPDPIISSKLLQWDLIMQELSLVGVNFQHESLLVLDSWS